MEVSRRKLIFQGAASLTVMGCGIGIGAGTCSVELTQISERIGFAMLEASDDFIALSGIASNVLSSNELDFDLEQAVRAEFMRGEVCECAGWLVSSTEAQLAALMVVVKYRERSGWRIGCDGLQRA